MIDNGDDYDGATIYQVTSATLIMTMMMRMTIYVYVENKTKSTEKLPDR